MPNKSTHLSYFKKPKDTKSRIDTDSDCLRVSPLSVRSLPFVPSVCSKCLFKMKKRHFVPLNGKAEKEKVASPCETAKNPWQRKGLTKNHTQIDVCHICKAINYTRETADEGWTSVSHHVCSMLECLYSKSISISFPRLQFDGNLQDLR